MASLGRLPEEGAMSAESGGAQSDPGAFMMRDASQALAPAELSFSQRDESFNGEPLANHARIGRGEMNVFAARLKARDDADAFEEADAPASEEAAVPEHFLGETTESGFEPTKGGSDEGCIGDIVLEGVDNVGDAFDDGHQYLGTELGSQGKLSSHNGTDMIFVEGNDPVWNRLET